MPRVRASILFQGAGTRHVYIDAPDASAQSLQKLVMETPSLEHLRIESEDGSQVILNWKNVQMISFRDMPEKTESTPPAEDN